jgi:hypothetical protein
MSAGGLIVLYKAVINSNTDIMKRDEIFLNLTGPRNISKFRNCRVISKARRPCAITSLQLT